MHVVKLDLEDWDKVQDIRAKRQAMQPAGV